jgi:hypothetical protein
MNIEKFNSLVNNRVNKDFDILNKEIEQWKQTVEYLYRTILSDFAEEIEKKIDSYNDILSKNYNYLKISLYYDNYYRKEVGKNNYEAIMIVFKDKNQKDPHSQTPKTNFNHLNIQIEHVRGLGDGEHKCIKANYFIATDHAVYEKKEIKTSVNELDKDKIIHELREFFNLFFEAFFERGYDHLLFKKIK